MHSGYDFKQIKKDMQSFEQKFAALKEEDVSQAACVHASMKDYFETLAKVCDNNFQAFMKTAVRRIQEK